MMQYSGYYLFNFIMFSNMFILTKVLAARDEMQWGEEGPPPLLVKIAPDLSKDDLEDIAAVCKCSCNTYFLYSPQYLMAFCGCRLLLPSAWMDW